MNLRFLLAVVMMPFEDLIRFFFILVYVFLWWHSDVSSISNSDNINL